MARFTTLLVSAMVLTLSAPVSAADLRSGMGGAAGYGQQVLLPNDDNFSSVLNSPFNINFFGYSGSSFFVNNNGNISFGSGLSTYTPQPFDGSSRAPMIAPFWADVDTRCVGCGAVYLGSQSADSFTVTWNDVGYYAARADKLNNFQMTLTKAGNNGDFDIEFRYNRLEWTTGEASGGVDGLGGTPAQAGFDAGDGTHFFSLPGSFSTSGALNFVNVTNVPGGEAGLYLLSIRNGEVLADGSSASAPLQPSAPPTPEDPGYHFEFNILPNQRIFVDPIVSVGYDFQVGAGGPNILTALLPDLGDADGYLIYLLSDLLHPYLSGVGAGGNPFLVDFTSLGGVSGFRVAGIDPALGLDPTNSNAFVTGLTFDVASSTAVSLTQTPLTVDTNAPPSGVPEPSSWAMLLAGFGVLGGLLRRRPARVVATA